ncbi:2-haloalkanoic acid dehalogenase, putative [Talaromyces stipitatus ATCC 10500]|uniref:2-haloalkanoic acid dehalogenase, putative n=1 Tax=Talaromyces stipitatus (strain ATCC 10500 / CBS 375.48 / QM 6759 / NRRL 1006) TaxID=441959 RepID=B8LVH6_TALSN|nr:2-haloalkanoic acid dehalogenase, putative [Talaromyces stipitatus ATCC 10500]EED23995.1 2-haloalkanoic acid dehalogenase, putative [Talaromyces stipitatus ATCC 10500]
MASPKKHIVFDVVGTCVSFDAFFDSIEQAIGPRLLAHNVTSKFFGFAWMQTAELEHTMLRMSQREKPYAEMFKALFYRVLYMAGIDNPRSFATDEERDMCHAGYSRLELRPDCKEMIEKLRDNGFTVWCLTTGDAQRVGGYFKRAGFDMPAENLVSCHDFLKHGAPDSYPLEFFKPSMSSYKHMLEKFAPTDQKWFAAAHMWDVSAAVKAGFRGAYCSIYEKESCIEVYDTKMDAMADSLSKMADKIIAVSSHT